MTQNISSARSLFCLHSPWLRLALFLSLVGSLSCGRRDTLAGLKPSLETDPSIHFGDVTVGESRLELLFLRNEGSGGLKISEFRLSGDPVFEIRNSGQRDIDAKSEAIWDVVFAPQSEGEASGTLAIISNDESGDVHQIQLYGNGVLTPPECIDNDDDGYGENCSLGNDCNDDEALANPGQTENTAAACTDGIDNDCDGDTDADDSDCAAVCTAPTTWYRDADNDGYGDAADTLSDCEQPEGYVANSDDCLDSNGDVSPVGTETTTEECSDSLDNDCDSAVDGADSGCEGGCALPSTWYRDADNDSYGNADDSVSACEQPTGYVQNGDDCLDSNGDVNPAATEASVEECTDSLDNDCDDATDAADTGCDGVCTSPTTWYRDQDNDGYGDRTLTVSECGQPVGFVDNGDDCLDTNFDVKPSAPELSAAECTDTLDNDCDGEPDSFDSDCAFEDCGDPADFATADVCNYDYPSDTGPRICEEYPNSPWPAGNREQCMDVCRSSTECPAGQACYPSRLSMNLHFCAPVLGTDLKAIGQSCTEDAQCVTAMCHNNICRDVCVSDADCPGADICRIETRIHPFTESIIDTGICQPLNASLLTVGQSCTSGTQCRSGTCAQEYVGGPKLCKAPCGSDFDCCGSDGVCTTSDLRCAGALYDASPDIGYGGRACASPGGPAGRGQSCDAFGIGDWNDVNCHSGICDWTYCPGGNPFDGTTCPIEPFCGAYCDSDDDCSLLFGGAYNLRMRCLISSSAGIQPLLAGYCAPHFCESSAECPSGSTCLIFNAGRVEYPWLAAGICQQP